MGVNTNIKMSYDDFPALFCAADKASITAQNQFVKCTAINLGLMILAAIVGSLILSNASEKIILATTSAILLTVCFIITVIIRITKLEQNWYDGRAIAESVKTVTWHYITGSDPYSIDLGLKADEMFISSLQSLLKARQSFSARLSVQDGTKKQITDQMRIIRSLDKDERKRIYLAERIDDQRQWYSNKSQANLRSANRYFIGTICSQGLAIITAFTILIWQGSLIQLTGIFTTLAAAFMAWTQMKRNDELAQSYGLAAQELNFIYEQSFQVNTEEQLSAYVTSAEKAISREHTMWLARRS